MNNKNYDLIIIGGGPAGMSAALIAGRTLMRTAIINAENPRNKVTTASHGFLSRDGIHPLELLSISKQQLEKYETVDYIKDFVTDASKNGSRFEVQLRDGPTLTTENIIFATGFKEDITKTDLPGIEQVYGKSVYPCPFCDGWEHKGEKLAVFGNEPFVAEYAKTISNWSDDLVIFTNGAEVILDEVQAVLTQGGIKVVQDKIDRLVSGSDGNLLAVRLSDGREIEREAGFMMDTHEEPASMLPQKLGVNLTTNSWGMEVLDADEFGKTNVEGLYIVGDAKSGFGGLLASARDGAACVEMMLHNRVHTKWATLNQMALQA